MISVQPKHVTAQHKGDWVTGGGNSNVDVDYFQVGELLLFLPRIIYNPLLDTFETLLGTF